MEAPDQGEGASDMETKNVKDLKEFLATLPAEADEWEVNFIEDNEAAGVIGIGNVTTGTWSDDPDEVPEGCKPGESFLLLSRMPLAESA